MRRVISLWLPTWPTDRLRRHRCADVPADVPLVTRSHDGRRMVIAAACSAARGLLLHAGMPLAHARAMVPGLTVVDATPDEDAEALRRLAAWCLRLSPMTAADEPDGVWIDATGCTHLQDGEHAMLAQLSEHLARHGLTARLAIADTPGAAHAIARFGSDPTTIIGMGLHAEALADLPIEALRIDTDTAGGLRRLGLERVGQLATTPRAPLARRFGNGLLTRLDQASGRVREPIQPVLPPDTISIRRTFVEPLSTPEAFVTVILVLVTEACTLLEQRGQGARQLDLIFERTDASLQVVRIGTARPARDIRHLARLLDERIEEVDPGPGVEAMRLVLPLVEPLSYAQRPGGLAPDGAPEADLSELIDRLVNRLGPGKVYRMQSVESDVPERSQQAVSVYTPLVPAGRISPWPRPIRLLGQPEPIETLAMLPDHPPKAFTWRKVRHRVLHVNGG
ncbi:DNA polymerase Y family protein (plasmid) [Lichenicola cladoniae]|uniref:DNA-directed DNA polymerase n=1 Tax=Lichenicola cladoniae TaxID=1484109 RepID=A0A6M8HY52_9PROT|nr:DNA polymerase Y family protein [Lichenicola cladoniae]NPD69319.1 DNA polymerase Y family protein [Acetobacteraceae bacterium]QKE93021.1 DNA polymerase Y family protein [Lichenicola cladoniae]